VLRSRSAGFRENEGAVIERQRFPGAACAALGIGAMLQLHAHDGVASAFARHQLAQQRTLRLVGFAGTDDQARPV
jgi:hypothetical protein